VREGVEEVIPDLIRNLTHENPGVDRGFGIVVPWRSAFVLGHAGAGSGPARRKSRQDLKVTFFSA